MPLCQKLRWAATAPARRLAGRPRQGRRRPRRRVLIHVRDRPRTPASRSRFRKVAALPHFIDAKSFPVLSSAAAAFLPRRTLPPRSYAVPVFDGRVFRSAARRVNLGGKALTNYLKEVVSYRCGRNHTSANPRRDASRGHISCESPENIRISSCLHIRRSMNMMDEFVLMERIKEQLCYVVRSGRIPSPPVFALGLYPPSRCSSLAAVATLLRPLRRRVA